MTAKSAPTEADMQEARRWLLNFAAHGALAVYAGSSGYLSGTVTVIAEAYDAGRFTALEGFLREARAHVEVIEGYQSTGQVRP